MMKMREINGHRMQSFPHPQICERCACPQPEAAEYNCVEWATRTLVGAIDAEFNTDVPPLVVLARGVDIAGEIMGAVKGFLVAATEMPGSAIVPPLPDSPPNHDHRTALPPPNFGGHHYPKGGGACVYGCGCTRHGWEFGAAPGCDPLRDCDCMPSDAVAVRVCTYAVRWENERGRFLSGVVQVGDEGIPDGILHTFWCREGIRIPRSVKANISGPYVPSQRLKFLETEAKAEHRTYVEPSCWPRVEMIEPGTPVWGAVWGAAAGAEAQQTDTAKEYPCRKGDPVTDLVEAEKFLGVAVELLHRWTNPKATPVGMFPNVEWLTERSVDFQRMAERFLKRGAGRQT